MAPTNRWFAASPNTDYIYKALTDGTVTNLTGGRIPKMNPTQAAGLVGSWLIETGRKDLSNLDVVEAGSGRGRGLSQYTGVRRTPYDQAVQQARAAGKDPNSAQWQIEYFAREYMNRDLIGWTKVFEKMPQNLKSPGEYAKYFTGSAAEGKGYFRPGTPHTDRRMQAAMEVYNHYVKGAGAPKPETPAAAPPTSTPKSGGNSFMDGVLQKLGIKGGAQSFNINKLEKVAGSIAANTPVSDIAFGLFASQKGVGNAAKAWKNLDNNTKKAYGRMGGQLAIMATGGQPTQVYSMPKSLSIGSGSQNYVGPKAEFNLGTSRSTPQGGSTTGTAVSKITRQETEARFKQKSNQYGQKAFNVGREVVGRINRRSYDGSVDLGRSLGISGSAAGRAAARGGDQYGQRAMNMSRASTNSNVARSYGGGSIL